ncbi:MAG: type II toxin-antitoxin system HicB family antitoxin [Firmicutes bacterium]|nr:type II toxin-antitoxin system HicB family antitoxin [Bacillota bacterium]
MMLIYPAIFHEEDSGVWAEFPDLEGCQTYGDTMDECIASAQEALGVYAESVLERGLDLPKASSLKDVAASGENSFAAPIYCDLKMYTAGSKAVKKTLTIPEWLNERAIKCNVNFSEVLQNALMEQLNIK